MNLYTFKNIFKCFIFTIKYLKFCYSFSHFIASFLFFFNVYLFIYFFRRLESLLKGKEIKPANPKGNQSWIFIGRIDAEAPISWPLDMKNWLIEKDPDDGKDWTQEEKGMTEDKMVVWHHQLNGHELSKLQEMMKDREPWGCKDSDMTEWLNNNWGFFFQTFIHLKRLSFPNGIGAFAKNCVCESWLLLHWSICLSLRSYSCLDFFFPLTYHRSLMPHLLRELS